MNEKVKITKPIWRQTRVAYPICFGLGEEDHRQFCLGSDMDILHLGFEFCSCTVR